MRVGLDESTAGPADQLQGAADGGRRNSLAAVPPVDEQTGDAEVGAPYEALLPLLAVVDVGQLLDRPELAPSDRNVAVEHQRSVGAALFDEPLLVRLVAELCAFRIVGAAVELGAPAAAPHAVVPPGEVGEGVPRLRPERLDPVAGPIFHGTHVGDSRPGSGDRHPVRSPTLSMGHQTRPGVSSSNRGAAASWIAGLRRRTAQQSRPSPDWVAMRIVIEGHDLPGAEFVSDGVLLHDVHVAVQIGKEPVGLVPGDADGARWEIDVRAVVTDGAVDLRGPAVHGRKGERFLYLTWGDVGAGGSFAMFRRAKLMIEDIEPALLAAVTRDGGVLVASLSLTDEGGCPRCARVKPPVISWRSG